MDRRTFVRTSMAAVAIGTGTDPAPLYGISSSNSKPGLLQARGLEIVADGKPVKLRGVNLGGWMQIEDYTIGLPWTEWKIREQFKSILGNEAYTAFFDAFDQAYIADADIAFLARQGFNVVRIPLAHRRFEDDLYPGVWLESGFQLLHRVVNLCRKYKIWVILDFHSLPGAQARDQNAGSAYGEAYLWYHREFLDRTAAIWGELARRYNEDTTIAGYNLICEPVTKNVALLNEVYLSIIQSVRKVDPDHLIMLDPNLWAKDITSLHDELFRDPQVIPVTHHYFEDDAVIGSIASYPTVVDGKRIERAALEKSLEGKYDQRRIQRPVLMTEFGLLRRSTQPFAVQIDITRDLISIFEERGWGWTLWCYKDLKEMGIVTPRADTPWRQFLDSPELTSLTSNYNELEAPFVRAVSKLLDATDIDRDTKDQWSREVTRDFDVPHLDFVLRRLAAHPPSELARMARSFEFASCEVHEDQLNLLKEFTAAK